MVQYNGDHTLDQKVDWVFGDGNTASTNATTTTHVYSTAGTYTAIANVTIRNGSRYCSYELEETITIN